VLSLLSNNNSGNGMNRGAGEDEHSSSPVGYDVSGAVAGEPPRWRRRTGNFYPFFLIFFTSNSFSLSPFYRSGFRF